MPRGAAVVVQPILRQDVQDVQGAGGCDEISLSWKERSRENDDVRKKKWGGGKKRRRKLVSESQPSRRHGGGGGFLRGLFAQCKKRECLNRAARTKKREKKNLKKFSSARAKGGREKKSFIS